MKQLSVRYFRGGKVMPQEILEWAVACLFIFSFIFLILYRSYKGDYKEYFNKCVEAWKENKELKKEIESLQNQLEEAKSWERVIKIEQVHAEPREYTCKFSVHERFIDDTEIFKKICISEVSRYMAEELEKDPMAYKVYFEKNAWTGSNAVKIMFRLLPYPEGTTSFEEIMDEVKRRKSNDII